MSVRIRKPCGRVVHQALLIVFICYADYENIVLLSSKT